jgi:hypothetical protein
MGIDPFTIAVAALATTAAGTVQQYQAGRKQEKAMETQAAAQQEQFRISQQQAEIQNVRAVRQQLRQRYAAAAALTARGATTGTLGGSGIEGGLSSLGAQEAANLSYMSDVAGTQEAMGAQAAIIGQAQSQYGMAAGQAAQGAVFANLGGTIFSQVGGFKTIFKQQGST